MPRKAVTGFTAKKSTSSPIIPEVIPMISAAIGVIRPEGNGRFIVRHMQASISRSRYSFRMPQEEPMSARPRGSRLESQTRHGPHCRDKNPKEAIMRESRTIRNFVSSPASWRTARKLFIRAPAASIAAKRLPGFAAFDCERERPKRQCDGTCQRQRTNHQMCGS